MDKIHTETIRFHFPTGGNTPPILTAGLLTLP